VRQEAAATLGDIGAPAKSAVPALRKALTDPSEDVRKAVADTLQQLDALAATAQK
jgi:HEAT repeat protein